MNAFPTEDLTSSFSAVFAGIIVARNANTFDFVLPNSGDPTAMNRSPNISPGGAAGASRWIRSISSIYISRNLSG